MTLTNPVVAMSATRKQITISHVSVYDTTLIYSRIIGLQKVRDINIKYVEYEEYELAPVPTAMFENNAGMRITKSKANIIYFMARKINANI